MEREREERDERFLDETRNNDQQFLDKTLTGISLSVRDDIKIKRRANRVQV